VVHRQRRARLALELRTKPADRRGYGVEPSGRRLRLRRCV